VHLFDHAMSIIGRAALLACVLASPARAERLPAKVYTTVDGLAHNSVHRIVSDSRGFLWFCTGEGLSRFDGYSFRNYGPSEGLPDPHVYDVLETRSGVYWVATGGGLCRSQNLKPDRSEMAAFKFCPLPSAAGLEVHSLAEGSDGTIWVGTSKALSRSVPSVNSDVFRLADPQTPTQPNWPITCLFEDHFRTLWIGTGNGLFRRWPDSRLQRYRVRALDEGAGPWINRFREDGQGRIWISTNKGILRIEPTRFGSSGGRLFSHRPGIRTEMVFDAMPLPDHTLWAVLLDGISRFFPDTSDAHLEPVTASVGLADLPLEAMALDRDRNIWIGSDGGGVSRIAHNGFLSFSEADGLGSHDIISVSEDRSGKLVAVSRSLDSLFLNLFSGGKFQAIRINVPSDAVSMRWRGHYQLTANTTRRDWWVATGTGLANFIGIADPAQLARVRPRRYLLGQNIFRLFEDSRGDLWVSNQHYPGNVLAIRNGRTDRFDRFPVSSGGPDLANDRIQAFSEDRSGAVWMGLEHSGLWRRSAVGFEHISSSGGLAGKSINWLYTDRLGRVWVGSRAAGVSRIDQPESKHPTFVNYGSRQGLSSNQIQCITEDLAGRIYVCTGRGVDRLEPATGNVKHYTTADGLSGGELQAAFRDRQGALWFGTQQGLSRLIPANSEPAVPVPVLLSGISVEGHAVAMSQVGETKVSLPDLSTGRDRVQFDFTGLSFETGEILRYQYRLEGAEKTWSPSTSQRSVVYAGLHPGSYRFLVRAINSNGLPSREPASAAFTILAPIWMRWWFLLTAFGIVFASIYVGWQYRVRQLAAVQSVRMRIATDLHDDIGSGLSQIAILSETIRKQSSQSPENALEQIATVSRELIDSMSDIVWATDPNRDQVKDLAQRMRQFAGEVLGGSDVTFQLMLDAIEGQQKLSVNVRRQLYLVFKECLINVIRHSDATEAEVSLSGDATSLTLKISDNGKGFDPTEDGLGHGLASMRERTANVGGTIRWTSGVEGTTVTMCVSPHG
jgi:ligand-binding sensor domain-containing protein/two-component sensor histidine kinase